MNLVRLVNGNSIQKKAFENMAWRLRYDYSGLSKLLQKCALLIPHLFKTTQSIGLRQPHPNLDIEVHLKTENSILRCSGISKSNQSIICRRDTSWDYLWPPKPPAFLWASLRKPPDLNWAEQEPCRTWYIYYDHSTCMRAKGNPKGFGPTLSNAPP